MGNPISDFIEEVSWSLSAPKDDNSTSFATDVFYYFTDIDNVFIFLIVGLVFFLIIWFISTIYKRYKIITNTPYANEALVGYYVKFSGKVAPYNYASTPIKAKKCEFFRLKIIGKWSIKAKSPGKGMQQLTKLLYMKSAERFLVKNGDMEIFVEFQNEKDIKSSTYKMKTIKGSDKTEISKHIDLNPKYSSYQYIINHLVRGDMVTIYGRLAKKGEEYIITDTYDTNYPFKIERGDKLST